MIDIFISYFILKFLQMNFSFQLFFLHLHFFDHFELPVISNDYLNFIDESNCLTIQSIKNDKINFLIGTKLQLVKSSL